jgi:hypothetical protein
LPRHHAFRDLFWRNAFLIEVTVMLMLVWLLPKTQKWFVREAKSDSWASA